MKHFPFSLPAVALTSAGLFCAAVLAGQTAETRMQIEVGARPRSGIVAANQPPCDPDIPNCCSLRCADDEKCLCKCYLAAGRALRATERYSDAVKYLQVAERLCPGQGVQALIDSIFLEQRMWVYQGKFAIATPLGEVLTPYKFSNPEPFREGVAIFSENDKYFFVDKDGEVLTPLPGYDGIIKAEGGIYCLIKGRVVSLASSKGIDPNYCVERGSVHYNPASLQQLGEWNEPGEIKMFLEAIHSKKFDYIGCFSEGLAVADKGGLWGYIDKAGQEIIPVQYDYAGPFREGLAVVRRNDLYGFIDKTGKEVIPAQFENVWPFYEGSAAVRKNGYSCFIDTTGNEIFPVHYDETWPYQEGLAAVKKDKSWGFIDKNGKEVIPPKYDFVWSFLLGQAGMSKGAKWGIIDKTGKEIVPPQYDRLFAINKFGHRWVVLNGKRGLINRKGEMIIPPRFESIGVFQHGLVWAKKEDKFVFVDTSGKAAVHYFSDYTDILESHEGLTAVRKGKAGWGFIDKNYEEVIHPQYENVSDFSEGLACIQRAGKFGYIDVDGNEVIPPQYTKATPFENNLSIVRRDAIWSVIDKSGRIINAVRYDSIWREKNELIFTMKNNKTGFLDKNGREIAAPEYDRLVAFSDQDVMQIQKNGKWGLINKKGVEVINPEYDDIGVLFDNELVLVQKNGKYGYVDRNGIEIIPPRYPNALVFSEGMAGVLTDAGNWGFIDKSGRIVIPGQYEEVGIFWGGLAHVKKNGKFGFVNQSGQVVVPLQYDVTGVFQNGIAMTGKDNKRGGIDSTGKEIIPLIYDNIWLEPKLNLIVVSNSRRYGFLSYRGVEIIPCILDNFYNILEDKIVLERNGKKGLYFSKEGNCILPEYDDIALAEDPDPAYSWVMVNKNGKWGWVNHKGEVQIPCSYTAATPFNKEGWAMVLHYNNQAEVAFRINRKGEMVWVKE